uniref:MATH domain-containing protein n=1 Tax=Oryza meridionalis TaxID=40149 RepID=A0A0E0EJA3_9ORYZ
MGHGGEPERQHPRTPPPAPLPPLAAGSTAASRDRRGVSSSSPSSLTIFRLNRRRRSPLPSTHPSGDGVQEEEDDVEAHHGVGARHALVRDRRIGVDEFIESATFAVGGYDWCIHFYPDGNGDGAKDYISVYLELLTKN